MNLLGTGLIPSRLDYCDALNSGISSWYKMLLVRRLAQWVEKRPIYRGCVLAAVDPGSTPSLGPFAARHSSSLILFPVRVFSCPINKAKKPPPTQKTTNAAARFLRRNKRCGHITPILAALYWLPVSFRIVFKILLLVFKAPNGQAPSLNLWSAYTFWAWSLPEIPQQGPLNGSKISACH